MCSPLSGAPFGPGEDQPGREREVDPQRPPVARRFGADPAIVGKTIRLDDQNFLVVGVMPDTFDFPMATDVWTPMALTPAQAAARAAAQILQSMARLKPGRTIEQAAARTEGIAAASRRPIPTPTSTAASMLWPVASLSGGSETKHYSCHAVLLGAFRAADRLRQRGQPAVRARHRPAARSRRAHRARRGPLARDRRNWSPRACCSPLAGAVLGPAAGAVGAST